MMYALEEETNERVGGKADEEGIAAKWDARAGRVADEKMKKGRSLRCS